MEVIIGDYGGFAFTDQKYAMGIHEWGRRKPWWKRSKNWEVKVLERLSVYVVISKNYFGSHIGKSYIKPSLKIFREVGEVSQGVLDDFHKKR